MDHENYQGWRVWTQWQPDTVFPWVAFAAKQGEVVQAGGFDADDALRRLKRNITREPEHGDD